MEFRELSSGEPGESSAAMRERVLTARDVQRRRFGSGKTRCNARMTAKMIKTHCALGADAAGLIQMAMSESHFSERAYHRILKVSRTIADLDGQENVQAHHVGEAIQYRTLDRNLWA